MNRLKRSGCSTNSLKQTFVSLATVPKFWIYTQALIVIFVLIGIVIAIIRLS